MSGFVAESTTDAKIDFALGIDESDGEGTELLGVLLKNPELTEGAAAGFGAEKEMGVDPVEDVPRPPNPLKPINFEVVDSD